MVAPGPSFGCLWVVSVSCCMCVTLVLSQGLPMLETVVSPTLRPKFTWQTLWIPLYLTRWLMAKPLKWFLSVSMTALVRYVQMMPCGRLTPPTLILLGSLTLLDLIISILGCSVILLGERLSGCVILATM